MVSGVFGSMSKYGSYGAHFLLGTGATTVGKEMATVLKNRKAANMGITSALGKGLKDGYVKSNKEMIAAGGFWKSLKKTLFTDIPKSVSTEWKANKGWAKIWKSVKPLGKALPFAMNTLWLLSSVPDVIKRTKDEGIWGGIKEAGKAVLKMGVISLTAAAAAPFGLLAMLAVPTIAGIGTDILLGKSYGLKLAEQKAERQQQAEAQQENPFVEKPKTGQKLDIMSE